VVFVALLRGINVGGKNIVSIKALKESFERCGFDDVSTYLNSGNVLFKTKETAAQISALGRTAILKLVGSPLYREMTVRNVNTTTELLQLMELIEQKPGQRA
jgi:uncharacterized protein (DUF1697 family)